MKLEEITAEDFWKECLKAKSCRSASTLLGALNMNALLRVGSAVSRVYRTWDEYDTKNRQHIRLIRDLFID